MTDIMVVNVLWTANDEPGPKWVREHGMWREVAETLATPWMLRVTDFDGVVSEHNDRLRTWEDCESGRGRWVAYTYSMRA